MYAVDPASLVADLLEAFEDTAAFAAQVEAFPEKPEAVLSEEEEEEAEVVETDEEVVAEAAAADEVEWGMPLSTNLSIAELRRRCRAAGVAASLASKEALVKRLKKARNSRDAAEMQS